MNQRSALEMILAQPRKGGMSKSAILLHQKQCEDFEKMEKEILQIKQKVQSIQENQHEMHKKLDKLILLSHKRGSFCENFKDIMRNKAFLYLLILFLCGMIGASSQDLIVALKDVVPLLVE